MAGKKENVSVIHLFLYRKIKEKANYNNVISTHDLLEVIRRNLYFIPKQLKYPFIRELENLGLIKRINKHGAKIIECGADKSLDKMIGKIKDLNKEIEDCIAYNKSQGREIEGSLDDYQLTGGKKAMQLVEHDSMFV